MKKWLVILMVAVLAMSFAFANGTNETSDGAAKWPKNVEIVVPAGAGGDTDFNARLLAQYLQEEIGSNFVISNVSGNGGATGTRQVKNATADGSSILFYHSAFVVNKASGTVDYGFDSYDFSCIAAMNRGNMIVTKSEYNFKNMADLKAYTQAHPNELKIAIQTGATTYAVAMQLIKEGFLLNPVDAGSSSARLAAILGGHVDVILAAYGSVKDYVEEGTLDVIGSDSPFDLEEVGVVSNKNQGVNASLPFYYFFAFPKGTPANLVTEFTAAVGDIVNNNEEYQQKIYAAYYQKPTFIPGEEGLKKYAEVEEILSTIEF
ncbi:tripartite tricarboxylate transporter substrate-binding protein [Sphaerochaeta sp. S2]|uniref:tripartite tricarboxylate transporter substrate-binding protein n=1 Tax=Sphaerochaeta sp. S2 TaxID=2798868 RepID=UPI0018E928A1|nr:tripartite tricarboxylate transporter substrate-binding protein [Sphaerochaeta sp. S2]MBJ2357681.1 tripartite tricarboxylate transporter substrate binding protein [Sphaerochaeta sp. S2]